MVRRSIEKDFCDFGAAESPCVNEGVPCLRCKKMVCGFDHGGVALSTFSGQHAGRLCRPCTEVLLPGLMDKYTVGGTPFQPLVAGMPGKYGFS